MSITAHITMLAFGLFPVLAHPVSGGQTDPGENGIWVSTCLGGQIFLDFGDKGDGDTPLLPNDLSACHAICRKVGSKIKIVPLAN